MSETNKAWLDKLFNSPPRKMSPDELAYEDALKRYEAHFGERFGLGFGHESYQTFAEIVEAINACIESDTPQKRPKTIEGVVY